MTPPPVRRRPLGSTGLEVSELGFGAWGVGRSMWGPTDDAESLAALARALARGVDFFDTAFVYGDGHSEKLIARAFAAAGRRASVATKVPPKNMRWPSGGRFQDAFPADWVVRCTERSLENLAAEAVEVQQFHVWRDEWIGQPGWDETRAAMERLTAQGKVRSWGVSIDSRRPKTALKAAACGVFRSMQLIFNLFEQEPADELLPLCRAKGVGVIVRVPLDEGGLTGDLREDTRFPEGDFRSGYFAGDLQKETVRRAAALEKLLVPAAGPTLAHAALRYCLSFPEVSTVIPGMRRPARVDANLAAAADGPLSEGLLAAVKPHAWKRD